MKSVRHTVFLEVVIEVVTIGLCQILQMWFVAKAKIAIRVKVSLGADLVCRCREQIYGDVDDRAE